MEGKIRLLSCGECGNKTNTELLADVGDKIPCPKCGKDCIVQETLNCHNCRFKYSCGYTGCLSGSYNCCEEHLYKEAKGNFWSLKEQKEVSEEIAKKHWIESQLIGIVEDDGESD